MKKSHGRYTIHRIPTVGLTVCNIIKTAQLLTSQGFKSSRGEKIFAPTAFFKFYPEHISQLSGLSKEHAIAACCSSRFTSAGCSVTALSTVNLIASVAAFVLR
ncbi:hypothetical protein D3C80_1008760 [compost metagenome]